MAGVRLHTVSGGHGPPLLLVSGWPQAWYAWRLVMPRLAQDYRVIAVDPRGVGVSDKPYDGYDSAALASELVALMGKLGHERFALAGHDVGMWTAYAAAADHPGRVTRLVLTRAGDRSLGPRVGEIGQLIAADPVNVIVENCGHYLPEEQPGALLAQVTPFLEPYRAG